MSVKVQLKLWFTKLSETPPVEAKSQHLNARNSRSNPLSSNTMHYSRLALFRTAVGCTVCTHRHHETVLVLAMEVGFCGNLWGWVGGAEEETGPLGRVSASLHVWQTFSRDIPKGLSQSVVS